MKDTLEFPVSTLPPLRGIITACNNAGVSHDATTLRKWLRMTRTVFKCERVDLRMTPNEAFLWPTLAAFAATEPLRLALRVPAVCPVTPFLPLLDAEPLELSIEAQEDDAKAMALWIEAAHKAGLPVHARVTGPLRRDTDTLLDVLSGARVVTVAAFDPFVDASPVDSVDAGREAVHRMNHLARELASRDVDVSLVGLPFCRVDEDNWPRALNSAQFFLDHLHYHREAYLFAERMFRFPSTRVNLALENLMARKTSVHDRIDAALFPWIQDYPRCYIRLWMYHKLTRRIPFLNPRPRPLPEGVEACDAELKRYRASIERDRGNTCSRCSFQQCCDFESRSYRRVFPGLGVAALPGDVRPAAPASACERNRYVDELDHARLLLPERVTALVEQAIDTMTRHAPTREIVADAYDIVDRYTHHMPGAVRWLSFGKSELQSTALTRLEPPFILSYTLGGGIAEHAGFAFGRHAKLVCPMIDYAHRVTLCVDKEGGYALLRDGQPVRPTQFEGASHVPARLGGVLEPRISLHNIDGMILTQTVLLWEGDPPPRPVAEQVKYSVLIISTRYTRRLQATLLALAHQRGVSPDLFEVVVGYVPGIDATDDLLDSLAAAFPELRLVRSPFPDGFARSKGFMINESLKQSSGTWTLLLDADIVLPPDTFERLEQIEHGRHFIAPEGRKMLPPHITGSILLNELRPWEDYAALLAAPGEVRRREADSIPIGFFQCVRREILERIPYYELDHFESSDWLFGRDVTVRYGYEYRMPDFIVLHLDHGGSQWYGTHKHR